MMIEAVWLALILVGDAPEPEVPATKWEFLARKYDVDRDGRITAEEYGRDATTFARLDRDSSGAIEPEDVVGSWNPRGGGARPGRREGERPERSTRAERPARTERSSALAIGDPAPEFALNEMIAFGDALTELGAAKPVALSSFRGDRPVALIFGSYT